MTTAKLTIVLLLAVATVLWVSGSPAQQSPIGDLGLTVRQDDMDSYWLDTHLWYWYGYRPYTRVHMNRYAPSMPTWATGTRSYSFGINEPTGNAPWEGGPKAPMKMTKTGNWR